MAASNRWLPKGGWRGVGAAALVALMAIGAGGVLHAQDPIPDSLSSLTGVVVDATHAPVPHVTVAVEDLGRRVTHRYETDAQGRFEAMDLPAGEYEVEISVPGFALFREQLLMAGPFVDREIVLAVRTVEETIEVGGDGGDQPGSTVSRESTNEPCVVPTDTTTQSPIGGGLRPPRMLTRTIPQFPDHLRQDGMGSVQLDGRIDETGAVGALVVVEASHPDFAVAAEDAVRGWTWEAALLNCTPVEVAFTVHIRFLPEP
jgi:hypothetical protein